MKFSLFGPLATCAIVCAGCSNIAEAPVGTSLTNMQAKFGSPTVTCPLAEAGIRAIWSQQPFGEYAWATNVNSDGNIGPVVQVLNDKLFEQLSVGVWDANRVQCEFGPPATIDRVGLPGSTKTVWSYRYRQYGVWYSMMYVFFDPTTNFVVDHYPGPDPWYLDDRGWFR